MTVYERFTDLLQNKGVRVADVTRATGIKSTVFSEWKKGKAQPKADKLQKIAEYFGVTMEYLMTGKEETFDEASDRLETDAGYLFYLLKDMGYTFDSDADSHIIESFDKREKYTLSGDQYEALSNYIENSGKAIISEFVFGQTQSEAVRESPVLTDQEQELISIFRYLNNPEELLRYARYLKEGEKGTGKSGLSTG